MTFVLSFANEIHVRHKEIIIINRCAEIYSCETVWEERSICPNSVKGDFHNPLTSRCETFDGQKLLAIL